MPLIPESVLDEVQARADIVEVVSRYVPLKRAGRHFKAHCPFHKERTPSFTVNPEKQIFHCFGCGVGGNVFSFVMQHDRLTFPEAVRQVADQVGVQLPERSGTADDQAQGLFALMDKASRFYERLLLAPQGQPARAYLASRGVSPKTTEIFRLGYVPEGWDHMLKAARAAGGVEDAQLEAAGLAVKGRSGGLYDRFRNRLLFPITDIRGRVLGFGGRSMDGREPKYLNSPESAIYTKGRHLFGLTQAKDAIVERKTAVVVEGYFDCVVLADAGLAHVVSPLGTALTVDQAKLLKRYAEQVILAFDPDAAGENATLRGIDILVEAGLHVRIAQLPDGVDPDEFVRKAGLAGLEQLLAASLEIFEFLLDTATRRHPPTDAQGKVKAAQFVLPTISKVPDAMLRAEYVRLLAQRLRLEEEAVLRELSKIQPRGTVREPSVAVPVTQAIPPGPERMLAALVLDEPSRLAQVRAHISVDDFTDGTLVRMLSLIWDSDRPDAPTSAAQVVSRLAAEGYEASVESLVALADIETDKTQALEKALQGMKKTISKRKQMQLLDRIRAAEQAGLQAEIRKLNAELDQLNQLVAQAA